MTETMTLISHTEMDEATDSVAVGHGQPLCGMEVKIVDADTGYSVQPDTHGRICVRGATLMRGYYKVPREETFDSDGWFHTSDAGFLDDEGRLHFTNRLDDMAKVAGVNVYPIEVERQLAQWGRLSAYTVVSLPHPSLGAAMILCAALTVGHSDETGAIDEGAIMDYLRSRLAGYQVPRRILLFDSANLKFTATQKVDLKAMRATAIERMLADDEPDIEWSGYLRELQSSGQVIAS
jgi:acyl-CoA synthetase (AMP-forming)/AMP-acid ligase II